MRKMRDIDAELKALAERQRALKARHVTQLGKLVIATGADVVDPEVLAGALIGVASVKDTETKEVWRQRGAAFFRRERLSDTGDTAGADGRTGDDPAPAPPQHGGDTSSRSGQGA